MVNWASKIENRYDKKSWYTIQRRIKFCINSYISIFLETKIKSTMVKMDIAALITVNIFVSDNFSYRYDYTTLATNYLRLF